MNHSALTRVSLVLSCTLFACEGVAELVSHTPLDAELFDSTALDAADREELSLPDPSLETGTFTLGVDGSLLYRLDIRRSRWSAEVLGSFPAEWKVTGLAVDPADPQLVYLLVAEDEEGRYRLYRGTGRTEWMLMSSFRTPLPAGERKYVRAPLAGLAAGEEGLLFRAEYVEQDADGLTGLSRSTLETYLIPLDRPQLLPQRLASRVGELWTPSASAAGYFAIRDIACTGAFTRRAHSLRQLAEKRNCAENPMAAGSRPAALLHGHKGTSSPGGATLASRLESAHGVSALEESHSLLLVGAEGLELYDSWLQLDSAHSYARLDGYRPEFFPSDTVSAPPALKRVAGVEARSGRCELPPEHPLFSGLTRVLKSPGTNPRMQAANELKAQLVTGNGFRCPCSTLSQADRFLRERSGEHEGWLLTEVSEVVQAEAGQRGCVVP